MVLSSATEAELASLFFNAKDKCMVRSTRADMGHAQPATPTQTDNAAAAAGIANDQASQATPLKNYWLAIRSLPVLLTTNLFAAGIANDQAIGMQSSRHRYY
jgi:hypothetical protein